MSEEQDIPTRVDNLEMKLAGVKMELGEIRDMFSSSIHELAQSNKEVAEGHKELSTQMRLLAEKIGDALNGFQTAVPLRVVYSIFAIVFALIGGIVALKHYLPTTF